MHACGRGVIASDPFAPRVLWPCDRAPPRGSGLSCPQPVPEHPARCGCASLAASLAPRPRLSEVYHEDHDRTPSLAFTALPTHATRSFLCPFTSSYISLPTLTYTWSTLECGHRLVNLTSRAGGAMKRTHSGPDDRHRATSKKALTLVACGIRAHSQGGGR